VAIAFPHRLPKEASDMVRRYNFSRFSIKTRQLNRSQRTLFLLTTDLVNYSSYFSCHYWAGATSPLQII
jgi:hypothetical protein